MSSKNEYRTIQHQSNMKAAILVWLVIEMVLACETKVVIFFPFPSVSHARDHTDMARAVAKLGHEAWVCIPGYLQGSQQIDFAGINRLVYAKNMESLLEKFQTEMRFEEMFWQDKTFNIFDIFKILSFVMQASEDYLKGDLYEEVKAVKPDLFVVDGISVMKSVLVIPYKLDIQYAFAGCQYDVMNARIPFSPVATPSVTLTYSDDMTFKERLHTVVSYSVEFLLYTILDNDVIAKYAPEKPYISMSDLSARAALYITEMDHILDYPRPTLPNTKLIGAAAVKDSQPLKEPYKTFMDNSRKGVIVMSFGSSILNVPDKIFQKMINAFSRLSLNVVWRVNATSPKQEKFLTESWIPQNDLLGHGNTKLLVSHCGKGSQYEALYHAVPILCFPIFSDQYYNAMRIPTKGFGLRGDIRKISVDELTDALKELLTNQTYKTNIARASKLFRLLYKSPMDEAAFWFDHVMEYGGEYMRASSQKMPMYQYLMIDVMALISFLTACLFSLCYFCICCCCCCKLCCKKRQTKAKHE